jgi:L-alanine-DL-glutamate epimerase-like enolase superfamily enzyme
LKKPWKIAGIVMAEMTATIQLASSLSNFYLYEHMYTENPLRDGILKEPTLECRKGVIQVPSGPGLGIEIDRGEKKYLVA